MITVRSLVQKIRRLTAHAAGVVAGRAADLRERLPLEEIRRKVRNTVRRAWALRTARRHIAGLPELAAELEAVMEQVEPRFLTLGEALQKLYADAGRLSELTRRSARTAGGETGEGGFLNRIDLLVRAALEELRSCRRGISDSLESVDVSLNQLGRLCNLCSFIEKTGLSLNVIGLNFAVESSRTAESLQMFEAFTGEIRKLSGQITGIAQDILEDSSDTRTRQQDAQGQILDGLDHFDWLNLDAERLVSGAVADIRDIMKLSGRILEQSVDRSRRLYHEVGEVVVAIQFHDIARQKIEHISWALRDAERLWREQRIETGENSKTTVLGQTYHILSLQAAQLREVISEIEGAHQQSRSAFSGLDEQVAYLVADIAGFDDQPRTIQPERPEQRIGDLQSGLEQLRTLLGRGYSLKAQIQETSQKVSETASSLSEHIDQVRGISMDLHLKALNAVVKSARLQEEGLALEVLAQEVSSLSRQASRFVKDVVDILQSLVSLSMELEFSDDLFAEAEEEASAAANIDIEGGIAEIAGYYEQFQADATAAVDDFRTLQSEIHQAGHSLGFLSGLTGDLGGFLRRIEAAMEALRPWRMQLEMGKEQMAQVAQRYTMISERRIHDQHMAPAASETNSPEVQEETPGEAEPDEELGDNVELF